MPGVEPGSNVYEEGPYDHVLLRYSMPVREEQTKGRRFDAVVRKPSRQAESNLASDASPIQRGSRGKRVRDTQT